jgi:hypothetical protein
MARTDPRDASRIERTRRLLPALPRLVGVGFAAALFACSSADGGQDLAEVDQNTRPTATPIIGGSAATAYPEAAIVDMYVNGSLQSACSGAVIAPQVLLTAGHCIEGFNGWRVKTPYASNQTANASGAAVYDWNTGGSEMVDPNLHDVGLVFLATPIKLTTYPTLAKTKQADGTTAYNLGRINNGRLSSTALYVSPAISLRDGSRVGYPYDYYANEVIEHGDSGGPVEIAGHTIVAVNSGAGGGTEVLARVDLVWSWIDGQVKAHGGWGTTTDPVTPPPPPPPPPPSGCSTGTEKEPNDLYTAPNLLGASACGALGSSSDQDWFKWSVSSTGVNYDLRLTATGDAQIQMWKLVSGSYYQVANTTTTSITKTSNGAGDYIVVVFSPSGQTQSWTMTLKR